MKEMKLLSTVAVTLLLSASAASAQGMNKESPERAPSAQQNAPAEKVAPSMKGGEQKAPETRGQATPGAKSDKAPQTTGQGAPDAKSGKAPETTGQSPKSGADDKAQTPGRSTDQGSKSGAAPTQSQSTTEQNRTTTGQGAVGAAKLSTEQRTKITSIIRQQKVEPAHLNVSVTVGTRIPERVHVYPLPVEVIAVYPEWRGYDYILVGDQIVIIDPRTHEIVAIVEA